MNSINLSNTLLINEEKKINKREKEKNNKIKI